MAKYQSKLTRAERWEISNERRERVLYPDTPELTLGKASSTAKRRKQLLAEAGRAGQERGMCKMFQAKNLARKNARVS